MSVCEGCHSGCCRAFAVPVTGADILRIVQHRELSFWDFACRWADPEGIISRNHAPQFYFDDEPGKPFVICLKHDPSELFPRATRCHFLVEEPADAAHPLGTAHCGIYNERPSACRVFPTRLSSQGDLAIIYDVPANGRANGEAAYQLCPRPWNTSDVDPIQQVQDLVVLRFEIEFFHKLAVAWNADPGDWLMFPDFLVDVYQGRVLESASSVIDRLPMSRVPPVDRAGDDLAMPMPAELRRTA